MATRMQQRRGTAAQWVSTNSGNGPILNAGEIGFETDTNKFKIGDGTNHWINLDYFIDASSTVNPAFGSSITFEGATADAYETTLAVADPTADRTVTIPNATGTIALTSDITTAINNLIDGAPAALDTLNELAAAINDDASYAATITTALGAKITAAQLDEAVSLAISNLIAGAPAGLNTLDELALAINDDPSFSTTVTTNLTNHSSDTTGIHGIEDTAELATKAFAASLLTGATKTNIAITGDKNGLTITAENGVADSTTDNLAEGTTNKYFTDERAQDAIGTNVGTGLSYNDTTGAISVDQTSMQARVADVSDTEIGYLNGVTSAIQTQLNNKQAVVADVSDTEIGYLNGVTSAIQTQMDAKAPLASPTFTGTVTTDDLIVDGDFTVNGTNFSASATSITIEDNLVQLAHQNAANTVDLGIVVGYNDGAAKHAGIVRDVSEAKWKLFKGVSTEPSTVVAFGEGSLDDLALNAIEAVNATFTGTVTGVTKTHVGLGNVDNTSDANKPISSATQTALNAKANSLITIDPETASYTLILTNQEQMVEMNVSSANTLTVPANSSVAFPVGTRIHVVQTGSGQTTITPAGGVTVNGTPGLKTRAQWSAVTLVKRATDTWVAFGDLTS